ncbi:MAG: hypothetical protein V5A44_03005 [Haloarculaceae archaeon]
MTRTSRCECPLCGFEDDRTTVYTHLQTAHRKSELSRRILAEEYGQMVSIRAGTESGIED